MKKSGVGFFVILGKLAPKFFSLLAKMAKGLKVGKIALAGGSMASYALLFSWEFAAMIMIMLFVHESGHIFAMKREGLKTKGIYFIPFFGAAAVADDAFPSRKSEVYIALMGPVWGLILSLIVAVVYLFTINPLFAAAASWMAMVNLFNLLPINPLDGGRVLKSVAFSINSKLGLVFILSSFILIILLIVYLKLYLFFLLLLINVAELAVEYKNRKKAEDGLKVIEFIKKNENLLNESNKSIVSTSERHFKERLSFSCPRMKFFEIVVSTFSYVLLILVLYWVMYVMQHVPSASGAMKVLVG